jgi:hypothetical protein
MIRGGPAIALTFWWGCRAFDMGVPEMCDYSLENVRSRPAKVGDKLTTRDFGTGTRGFAAAENAQVASRSEISTVR